MRLLPLRLSGWMLPRPQGRAGTTLVLPGALLSSAAQNGLPSGSNAHRIELQ